MPRGPLRVASEHRTTEGIRTMRSHTTRTYAVALGLASTLALAGCSEGDETPTASPPGTSSPTTSTSPSGSSSATGSVTPSPSASVTVPSAARVNTNEGAVAFGKHFITELDRAYVSTDSSQVRNLSSGSCGGCKAVIVAIDGLRGDGVHQAKPAVTIAGAQFVAIDGAPAVDVFASYASVPRIDATGKQVTPGRAEKVAYRLSVIWSGQNWQVVETDVLNS